jgi:hypothetical protein
MSQHRQLFKRRRLGSASKERSSGICSHSTPPFICAGCSLFPHKLHLTLYARYCRECHTLPLRCF